MARNTKLAEPKPPPAPPKMSYAAFRNLIALRAKPLLALAGHICQLEADAQAFTRPLLGDLLSQASQLEELLDSYGAQNNQRWHPFRSLVATIRRFSNVHYILLHIQHSLPAYRLLPIRGDLVAATAKAVTFAGKVIARAAHELLGQAKTLDVSIPRAASLQQTYLDELPLGRLCRNRTTRTVRSAEATVAHLATAYLSLAAESELLHIHRRLKPKDYAACIPSPLSEEQLRQLQQKFHSLQSLYDTFVSDTNTESLDPCLPVLRGHISVIFHLLEAATELIHHYERHMSAHSVDSAAARRMTISPNELLRTLMAYCIAYASRYVLRARSLCQAMLKRYAEVAEITVSAPRYRGFHVRPSTLIAKITQHYGSEVRMLVNDETYDTSSPMDIFRANEKINAKKRRWLSAQIEKLDLKKYTDLEKAFPAAVHRLLLTLAADNKVVIYQRPLEVKDRPDDDRSLLERAVDEIARLQATGRIDIETPISVRFVGDRRVLADIDLLAECGYGEDNFGNNVPLVKELSYLRR